MNTFVCLFVLGVDLIPARLRNIPKDWLVSCAAINSASAIYKSTSWTRRGGDDVWEISTIRRSAKKIRGGWRADFQSNGPSNIWYSQVLENHVDSLRRRGGGRAFIFFPVANTLFKFFFIFYRNWSSVWLLLRRRRLLRICAVRLRGVMSHELLSLLSAWGAFRSIIIPFTIYLD